MDTSSPVPRSPIRMFRTRFSFYEISQKTHLFLLFYQLSSSVSQLPISCSRRRRNAHSTNRIPDSVPIVLDDSNYDIILLMKQFLLCLVFISSTNLFAARQITVTQLPEPNIPLAEVETNIVQG